MGRKKKPIDSGLVERLARIQCTYREIAAVVGCGLATLETRFRTTIEKGREYGKASLRRCQWKVAVKGNPTMLVWLGKQWLDQRDKSDVFIDDAEIDTALQELAAARQERLAAESQGANGTGAEEAGGIAGETAGDDPATSPATGIPSADL